LVSAGGYHLPNAELWVLAPIDIQITGTDLAANAKFANRLMEQIKHVPGAVDFRIEEPNDVPQFDVKIDRSLASIVGVNAQRSP
jgi:Cu/Ag efflux pump CusA